MAARAIVGLFYYFIIIFLGGGGGGGGVQRKFQTWRNAYAELYGTMIAQTSKCQSECLVGQCKS